MVVLMLFAFMYVRAGGLIPKRVPVRMGAAIVQAEVVKTDAAQRKGLGGRSKLPAEDGMLFVFNELDRHSFWMKDMQFPIDIFWIQGDRIVDIRYSVPPPADENTPLTVYYPQEAANFVLETNAGFAEKESIQIGDTIEFLYPVEK